MSNEVKPDVQPSRDDSILYSGSASGSFSTPTAQPAVTELQEEKKELRAKLEPAKEVIFGFIEEERVLARSIDTFPATDQQQFYDDVRARQLYLGYLERLKIKVDNALRDNPKRRKK